MVVQSEKPPTTSPKRPAIFIKVIAVLSASTYALSQVTMSAGDKYIFKHYKQVTPMGLLFANCLICATISLLIMLYKEVNRGAFHFTAKYGLIVPPISDLQHKF